MRMWGRVSTRAAIDWGRGVAVLPGVIALLVGTSTHAAAQAGPPRTEIIQGRATSAGTTPVPGAQVVVTMAPDRLTFTTRTDTTGGFRLVIPNGTGDYLVGLSKIGYTPFRKRVTRAGADTVYVVNADMPQFTRVLDAVQVSAARAKPVRTTAPGLVPDAGAAERVDEGLNGILPPELAGDLTAIAAAMPGVVTTPDGGLSVFGLGAGANNVTLNGMAFAGADIPRDANVRKKVATSSYDPARGWFAGAQTTVELGPGDVFSHHKAHLTLDAPPLHYQDPISARLGQRIARLNASYGANGPLGLGNRYFYNLAFQGGRSTADAASVLTADPALLQRAGVSADSVVRLRDLLTSANVPLGRIAPRRTNDDLSFIARFDDAPYDWNNPGARPKVTKSLVAYGRLAETDGLALTPTSTLGHGGKSQRAMGMLQAQYSRYVSEYYLYDAATAFTLARDRSSSYLRVPDGNVLVVSDFPGAFPGIASLEFGGNGALPSDTRRWTWETTSSFQGFARARQPHRIKGDFGLRLDGISSEAAGNSLGTFTYNSLADLAGNRPAIFRRTLETPARSGSEWNGFLSVSDEWRPSSRLQVLYGLRAEANRFTSVPTYNPAVERSFGLRTDQAPNTWAVSPRLGFTWVATPGNPRVSETRLGRFTSFPATSVRGGVGLFRAMLPASLLSGARLATGLPNGLSQIACIGDAVPAPNWSAYASDESSIPTSCVGGGSNADFADASLPVQVFDPSFTAPRSWRANLAASSRLKSVIVGVEGTYSLNRNQRGIVDANFRGTPQFTLSGENRPVFVPASAIVSSTGSVSSVPARRDSLFGFVTRHESNLQSRSRQLTVTAMPTFTFFAPGSIWRNLYVSGAYTLSDVRAFRAGFDATTFGDPSVTEWARGDFSARHSFITAVGFTRWGVAVSMYARVNSGLPFTPVVAQDVNGDGRSNDRAFIFNPATADARIASALDQLITTGPEAVRSCLRRQLGAVAARNSCEGPWTSTLNGRITVGGRKLRLPSAVDAITLNLTNPLGGLDRLIHGDGKLHGWGASGFVDPILYTVRGFDPASRSFAYEVNPRFGATNSTLNAYRAPFRLTLDVSMTLGRSVEAQQLERWLNPGRAGRPGPKLGQVDLVRRYIRTVPDPYAFVMREADSLLLTPAQLTDLQAAQRVYQQKLQTHMRKLADYLVALPDAYDVAEAFNRQEAMTDEAWAIVWSEVHDVLPRTLLPIQLDLAPDPVSFLRPLSKPPKGVRMSVGR